MNFTGFKKPTDAEFKNVYKELFESCPRPKDYNTEEYKAKVEIARRRFFDFQKKTMDIDTLPWEFWKKHPNYSSWEISNLGRIKIDGRIQEQIDNPDGSKGYLVLKNYTSKEFLVYRLVADVFLERKEGEGRIVHHINNDGYNCSEDNLIMLTKTQDAAIHTNEKKEL